MAEMGIATIYPSTPLLDDTCLGCSNHQQCFSDNGITVKVNDFEHLYLPDYKNSWTLFTDIPNCKKLSKLFASTDISASLYTGNKVNIKGKIIKSRISSLAELFIVEL